VNTKNITGRLFRERDGAKELFSEMKPMPQASLAKEMARTSTTNNPYLKGGVTRWPMPDPCPQDLTEASSETETEVSKAK
jgi:hypothetical protein